MVVAALSPSLLLEFEFLLFAFRHAFVIRGASGQRTRVTGHDRDHLAGAATFFSVLPDHHCSRIRERSIVSVVNIFAGDQVGGSAARQCGRTGRERQCKRKGDADCAISSRRPFIEQAIQSGTVLAMPQWSSLMFDCPDRACTTQRVPPREPCYRKLHGNLTA